MTRETAWVTNAYGNGGGPSISSEGGWRAAQRNQCSGAHAVWCFGACNVHSNQRRCRPCRRGVQCSRKGNPDGQQQERGSSGASLAGAPDARCSAMPRTPLRRRRPQPGPLASSMAKHGGPPAGTPHAAESCGSAMVLRAVSYACICVCRAPNAALLPVRAAAISHLAFEPEGPPPRGWGRAAERSTLTALNPGWRGRPHRWWG